MALPSVERILTRQEGEAIRSDWNNSPMG
ncbi:hypothetical protein BOS5A_110155 [Bosea sp. EC-HK365B]|nr:hypothetical protein BOSE7B_10051 [Bosea sp. 7B]VVT50904.1 hypothetical protein BOS5A_110155 [Bosea sp. EC-HK365B]VXC48920.1 hypothetical protein BOSE125_230139 [Bosea sp. 125]